MERKNTSRPNSQNVNIFRVEILVSTAFFGVYKKDSCLPQGSFFIYLVIYFIAKIA